MDVSVAEYVALWVQTLLYGLYIVLFSVCMYIFYTRKTRGHRVLFLAAIAMFTLSTAHVIVDLIIGIFDLLFAIRMSGMINPALSITNPVIYITNNIIADGLLIYRCYVVWGYSRTIVLVPILTLMATTALGYSFGSGEIPFSFGFAGTNRLPSYMAFFCLSLATNVIVTALTAGRIWFISRQARDGSGKHAIKHYHTAIAIVLESGAIYSMSVMIMLILFRSIGFVIIYAALAQIVGIVPTMIIVRVALGVSTDHIGTFAPEPISESDTRLDTFQANPGASILSITDARRGHDRV